MRAQSWNYASEGIYFITINTKNFEHLLGEIKDGEMILTDIGRIVEEEWIQTPELRKDMNLELGAFVVMPNHFHGLICIGKNEFNKKWYLNENERVTIEADNLIFLKSLNISQNKFGPQSKNIASIVRGFKSAVTSKAKKIDSNFSWHPSFHDIIVRDANAFLNIQAYIENNPKNWKSDKYFKR